MKKTILFLLILVFALTACTSGDEKTSNEKLLTVIEGDKQKQYTIDNLRALPQVEASFNDTGYIGVSLVALLVDAGVDVQSLSDVKAIASDGYSVKYEREIFQREDVILAYAQVDGPLAEDDGTFRMVLPGAEGKLNVRKVVEIQAIP